MAREGIAASCPAVAEQPSGRPYALRILRRILSKGAPPDGPRIDFAPLKQPSGKVITAFAVRGDLDLDGTFSNTFELEWPKGSGNVREFPEIDRVGWFSVAEANLKLLKGQRPLLDRLTAALEGAEPDGSR